MLQSGHDRVVCNCTCFVKPSLQHRSRWHLAYVQGAKHTSLRIITHSVHWVLCSLSLPSPLAQLSFPTGEYPEPSPIPSHPPNWSTHKARKSHPTGGTRCSWCPWLQSNQDCSSLQWFLTRRCHINLAQSLPWQRLSLAPIPKQTRMHTPRKKPSVWLNGAWTSCKYPVPYSVTAGLIYKFRVKSGTVSKWSWSARDIHTQSELADWNPVGRCWCTCYKCTSAGSILSQPWAVA